MLRASVGMVDGRMAGSCCPYWGRITYVLYTAEGIFFFNSASYIFRQRTAMQKRMPEPSLRDFTSSFPPGSLLRRAIGQVT